MFYFNISKKISNRFNSKPNPVGQIIIPLPLFLNQFCKQISCLSSREIFIESSNAWLR